MAMEPTDPRTRGRDVTAGAPTWGALAVAAGLVVLAAAVAVLSANYPALVVGLAAGLLLGPALRCGRRLGRGVVEQTSGRAGRASGRAGQTGRTVDERSAAPAVGGR